MMAKGGSGGVVAQGSKARSGRVDWHGQAAFEPPRIMAAFLRQSATETCQASDPGHFPAVD